MTREQQVKKIGDWLRAYRKANKLKQTELGEIIGVSATTISRLETYEASPTKWTARKIQEFIDEKNRQSEPEALEQNVSDMQRAALIIADTVGSEKAIAFIAGELEEIVTEDIDKALDALIEEAGTVCEHRYTYLLAGALLYTELIYRQQRREQA